MIELWFDVPLHTK